MNKIKISLMMLLLTLSTYALAGTMIVRDNGLRYIYTCQNQCVFTVYANGLWTVVDSGGGEALYVVMVE